MSSTATVVASEPVPDVVGIARCGSSGPGGRRPAPTGALTYSITGAGWETIRSATFAVSIAEPPPTDTKPSTRASRANAAASSSDSSVGSTRARPNATTSIPAASIAARTRSG
jgi:hypothetical protein